MFFWPLPTEDVLPGLGLGGEGGGGQLWFFHWLCGVFDMKTIHFVLKSVSKVLSPGL